MEEIKQNLVGKWKMDRSEHFEDFLREVGANMVIRKLASLATPTITISVEGETITIATDIAVKREVDVFKLDEEFDMERQGEKFRSIVSWEDGKLKTTAKPRDPKTKMKAPTVYRERVGDEMLLMMCIGDVVCKRYFKRLQ